MGMTIAEKILARAGGVDEVTPGQSLPFRPDYLIAYDFPGYTDTMFRQLKEDFGVEKVSEPGRYVLFIDHMTTKLDQKERELHEITRQWAAHNGVALYEGKGIGHQVMVEYGYTLPGRFLVHFDGHISQAGAFGCLGWGVRRDIIEPWLTGQIYLDVPSSKRFELDGELGLCVTARDLIHYIIKTIGADGCVNQVMEYAGSGADHLSRESRQSLCAMAMFTGAVSAIFNPNEDILEYARKAAGERSFDPVYSDPDANYSAIYQLNLSSLNPQVVLPGSARSRNTVDVSEVAGEPVQRGFIGSCASGRVEDIRAAARILEGRRVAPGFQLTVVPTSERIKQRAIEEGLLDVLTEAGAQIGMGFCDFCYGYTDQLKPGEKCVSTGVLNIPGRMGSLDASIYMASPFTIAASAITGHITDPRSL